MAEVEASEAKETEENPPEEAKDLNKILIAKLWRKVQADKSLTAPEIAFLERREAIELANAELERRRILDEEAQGILPSAKITSKGGLAAELGVDVQTLDIYWKRADSPKELSHGVLDVGAWRRFLLKNLKNYKPRERLSKVPGNGKIEESRQLSYRERKERAEALTSELEFKAAEGKLIDKRAAVEDVRKANETVKAELTRRMLQVAPNQYANVDGDADLCRMINATHLEEIFEFLHNGEWKVK